MPLARLLQYLHACWRSHDVWTVEPLPSKEAQMMELEALTTFFDTPSGEDNDDSTDPWAL
jgi:hypothetical protein